MITATIFGLCGAALVGLGLYGVVVNVQPLRKLLAFNVLGCGVFLIFGAVAKRGGADPIPQALVITGVVVAFAATALAITLLTRLFEETGRTTLEPTPRGDGQPQ
jgi:multicomponent Na+:H+ antiporter subunit C